MTDQTQPNNYWPQIEQFFDGLPPRLFRQGVLLKNNLAIDYSDTGQFSDILRRTRDYPLLHLHRWLLDDLNVPSSAPRSQFEQHLFVAMVFTFAAIYLHDNILDQSAPFDPTYSHLEHLLTQQADFHLAQLFPGDSLFWSHYQTFWRDYAEAKLSAVSRQPSAISRQLAFGKIPVAATAIFFGRENLLPQLLQLVDGFNFVFQLLRDVATLQRDIKQRRPTYPLIKTMEAANIDPKQPVQPEQLLGAVVLTGSVSTLCQEMLNQLDECHRIAQTLGLPSFIAYFSSLEDLILSVKNLFSLKRAAKSTSTKLPDSFFVPPIDPLARAISMAEGYLLSDLSFRESWEVQRGGPPDMPEMIGRAFPSGLIIEILCRHGHNHSRQVDGVFELLRQTQFRYYDYAQLPPDADDLGLLLRLLRYASPKLQPIYRDLLQTPLKWMADNILPSGEIPVWFKQEAETSGNSILVWGNSCAATEVNLLLGLIDYDWAAYRTIIEKSALNLLERFSTVGLSASLYYPPPYTLFVTFKLFKQLTKLSTSEQMADNINQLSEMILKRWALETQRPSISPQDAALYSLTCVDGKSRLLNNRWLDLLLKSQRYDGSWDGEPFFLIPDRGRSAWYASRTLTTAYCYQALLLFARSR